MNQPTEIQRNQDIAAALGAVTPVILQLLLIDPETFTFSDNLHFYAGFGLKIIALIWSGILYNKYLCQDVDVKKVFINGMAAPSILIAVFENVSKITS